MKKDAFILEMKWFCEFYDKILNDTQIKIWFECFENMHHVDFHERLIHHIKSDESPFFPAIGKLQGSIQQVKYDKMPKYEKPND